MDDCCAVCADTLEWVAYGPCGHRDVCSTCVVRLRFICDDRRCCICKTQCDVVYVTKALGDYTRNLSDFSKLPFPGTEGRMGSYWYHEDTQTFFDDAEQYKMIKAMCRLSCSVCDQMEDQQEGGFRRQRFRSIGQLKGHLSHQHKLYMCELCLEGRKVFICEQKLYTRVQLNQHKRTGDSEVDGTESERGGFAGHPMCEFCFNPFYGENELYSHMSTEHYTCHICQRRNPGHYEYYKGYDDLEIHFRNDHFLCEDEGCLAKKFTVFQSESEIKRHNALEHGGRMSRSKRNAVLQIPTSFRYQSSYESGHHRGRRRTFRRESSQDNELSMAIQASLEGSIANGALPDPSPSSAASPLVRDNLRPNDIDPLVVPFESLSTSDSEPSSRYRLAVSQSSSSAPLRESAFPPLSSAATTQQSAQQESNRLAQNTMAARIRGNVGRSTPAVNHGPALPSSGQWPTPGPLPGSLHSRPVTESSLATGIPWASRKPKSSSTLSHSSSAPDLIVESRSFDSVCDFPPVSTVLSAVQSSKSQNNNSAVETENVQTANKSLVDKIRTALEFDENKYSAFKDISQEYRQGLVDAGEYVEYVRRFNLIHLVLDLARLCPDPHKQRELIDCYNATQTSKSEETFWGNGNIQVKSSNSSSRKDKGKKVGVEPEKADSIISTVKSLQSQLRFFEEGEVEVLEKDGYRNSKGKSTPTVIHKPVQLPGINHQTSGEGGGGGGIKQKKKTQISSSGPSTTDVGVQNPSGGVWRGGGGQRLFAK